MAKTKFIDSPPPLRYAYSGTIPAKRFVGKNGDEYRIFIDEKNTSNGSYYSVRVMTPGHIMDRKDSYGNESYEIRGDLVGYLFVVKGEDGVYRSSQTLSNALWVRDDHRRNGIATAMHDYINDVVGVPTAMSDTASSDAKGFWGDRDNALDELRKIVREILKEGVIEEEVIEETFTAQKDLEEFANNIIIKLSQEAVREWEHNHFLNPEDSDLRFLPTIYTGTMKGEGYSEIGNFVDETSIKVQLTIYDINGDPSTKGNLGYGITPRGSEVFEIKVKYKLEDLEEINKIFREKGEGVTYKDVYIKLWFIIHSTLLHEIQHAYDGWRSKGKAFYGQETREYKDIIKKAKALRIKSIKDLTPEEMDAIDTGASAYLNLTHEINARFTQALHKISLKTINIENWDDKMLPWKHVYTSFRREFKGWHVLSDKMKKKLTRRLAKAYQETNENLKTAVEKFGEKEAAEITSLTENVQLADKVYFKPGKLSPKVRQVIIDKITGGDAWTKLISDIYYAELQASLRQSDWLGKFLDDPKAESIDTKEEYTTDNDILQLDKWKEIKSFYGQLKSYNKNLFPIKGLNPNGVEDTWDLIRGLKQRAQILEMIKRLPSVALRNMREDIRAERTGEQMNNYRHGLDYFLSHYSLLDNRDEELRKFVERKMFKSGVTLEKLLSFVEEKENLLGGKTFDKQVIKNIIDDNNHGELEVIYESGNIMVVEVGGPYGIKEIGCNSLWCFTYGEGYSRHWNQYSYNDTVYVIIDFDEPSDSTDFMNVVIKPLVWNPTEEEQQEINDEAVFNMANENRYDALPYLESVLGLETAKKLLNFYVEPEEEGDEDEVEEEPGLEKDPAQLSLFEARKIVKSVLKEQISEMDFEYYNSFTKDYSKLSGTHVFIRFGEPPMINGKYSPSSISRVGEKISEELGISVYDAVYDENSGFYALQQLGPSGNLGLSIAISQGRTAYLVSGKIIGEGSDGEPLLSPETFKVIKEIPYNKILSSLDRGNLDNNDMRGKEEMYPINESVISEYEIAKYKPVEDKWDFLGGDNIGDVYEFNINGVDYIARIYENRNLSPGTKEIDFRLKDVDSYSYRTNKGDLFSVVYTVGKIMEDVAKRDKIKRFLVTGESDTKDYGKERTSRGRVYERIIRRMYPESAISIYKDKILIDMTKVYPDIIQDDEMDNILTTLSNALLKISDENPDPHSISTGLDVNFDGSELNGRFPVQILNSKFGKIQIDFVVYLEEKFCELQWWLDNGERGSKEFDNAYEMAAFIQNKFSPDNLNEIRKIVREVIEGSISNSDIWYHGTSDVRDIEKEKEEKPQKDLNQLSLFEYIDLVFNVLNESDEPSPTFEWNIAKEKIDNSLKGVDTKSEAIQYLKKFFDKIKNLPKAVKNGVAKYVVMALVGLLGYNLVLSMIPEGMPEVTKEIIIQMSTEEMNKPEEPHVNPTSSSEQLVDFLKHEEGSIKHKGEPVLKAYKIGDGMVTVGWGHAERIGHSNFNKGDKITRAEAERLLNLDIKEAEGGLNRLLKRWEDAGVKIDIDQGMYDAMTSMIFNMGIGNFLKSDFIQLVKQGKFEEARDKILTTNVSYPGHVPRREKEAEMFGKNLPYMADNQSLALKEIRKVIREVFSEGVDRRELNVNYFIKRIPFIKGYEVVYEPEHYPHSSMPLRVDMTNRRMSTDVTLPVGDEVYTFPKVYAISEFFYYPHTINDNTFHIVGVTNKIHLEKPDNMSQLQYQVLTRAMQMMGEQEMSSINEIIVPAGEDISDSEMDKAISEINKKMFAFEDALSDWQVEKMF